MTFTIEAEEEEVAKVAWAEEECFRLRVRLHEGVVLQPLPIGFEMKARGGATPSGRA